MNEKPGNNTDAGKGDKPRSCFSKKFKENYDLINWGKNKKNENKKTNNTNSDTEFWL